MTERGLAQNPKPKIQNPIAVYIHVPFCAKHCAYCDFNVVVERLHSASEAERAIASARSAGFANISLDLMFGLPGQTQELWRRSLNRALQCGTEHLSLYALSLEPGTRFERLHRGGKLELPDE